MLKKHPWIWAFIGFAVAVALAVLAVVGVQVGSMVASSKSTSPDSALPSPTPEAPVSSEPSPEVVYQPSDEDTTSGENPDAIQPSEIQRLTAPTAGIDVEVSGEVWQAPDSICPEDDVCIKPPVEGQAAWYGEMIEYPEIPSNEATLLFGHADSTFDGLSDLVPGDHFYVTTDKGEFAYMVGSTATEVYDDFTHRILLMDGGLSLVAYDEDAFETNFVIGHLMEAYPS